MPALNNPSDESAARVTTLLNKAGAGDAQASADLLPLVYERLRALAGRKMQQERPDQTLQATALVHEAYLRLVGSDDAAGGVRWNGRGHFFAAAAEAMRRILIDNARRKQRPKHGGNRTRVEFDEGMDLGDEPSNAEDLLALDEALTKLAAAEPVKAELVKLRFFAGLTIPQAAEVLGISEATAERYWTYARAWLHCELEPPPGSDAQLDLKKTKPSPS